MRISLIIYIICLNTFNFLIKKKKEKSKSKKMDKKKTIMPKGKSNLRAQ